MNLSPQDEPSRLAGSVVVAVNAILAVIAYFTPIDPGLKALIVGAVSSVATVAATFYYIRNRVTPVGKQ